MNEEDPTVVDPSLQKLRRAAIRSFSVTHRPRLLGCHIGAFGPIKDACVGLEPGPVILYGKNGAGKSKILEVVAALARADQRVSESSSSLYFQWVQPVISGQESPFADSRANPWNNVDSLPKVDDAYNEGIGNSEYTEWLGAFNKAALAMILLLLLDSTDEEQQDPDLIRLYQQTMSDLISGKNQDDESESADHNRGDHETDSDAQSSESPSIDESGWIPPNSPISNFPLFGFLERRKNPGGYWDGAFRRHLRLLQHIATANHAWEVDFEIDFSEESEIPLNEYVLLSLEAALDGLWVISRGEWSSLNMGLAFPVSAPSLMSRHIQAVQQFVNTHDVERDSFWIELDDLYPIFGDRGRMKIGDWFDDHWDRPAHWWEGVKFQTSIEPLAPAYVLTEEKYSPIEVTTRALTYGSRPSDDETNRTLDSFVMESKRREADLRSDPFIPEFEALLSSDGTIKAESEHLLQLIAERANDIFRSLFEHAPELTVRFQPVYRWKESGVVEWNARDLSGVILPLEFLSNAQLRWAKIAIELASIPEDFPIRLVCLDEPEAGLHRRAERFLAQGLSHVTQRLQLTTLIATHSPEFLAMPSARLHHVHRDQQGKTSIEMMTPDLRGRLDDFGLGKVDLLQLCRLFLVVEGQHDLIVLGELIGDDLRKMGVELMALRGLRNLKNASDAQLLFRFTDAKVLYLADNEQHDRIASIWDRARNSARDEVVEVLAEMTRGSKDSEASFLREFATLAHTMEVRDRIFLSALSLGDILEYLPVDYFVSKNADLSSWSSVKEQWRRSGSSQNLKSWMSSNLESVFSDEVVRSAAQALDEIPKDFVDLLNFVETILESTSGMPQTDSAK